jgi:ubiquitin carboxyl-terminal hydrolase 16/45
MDKNGRFAQIILQHHCHAVQKIAPGQQRIVYSLYGVIEHSGTMRGGHYTAYVKVREPNPDTARHLQTLTPGQLTLERQVDTLRALRNRIAVEESTDGDANRNFATAGRWFNISDSSVNEVHNVANVLRCEAYILFYERVF